MKKTYKKIIAGIFLGYFIAFSSFPQILLAAEIFDPEYILSDTELQEYSSMSLDEIQEFLEYHNSYLANYKAKDINGRKQKASKIIYDAAKRNKINPKYLLVKLQKEQSLITDKAPTKKALDGATGYGIDESCGWSCDIYLKNKGFGAQVDSAAAIMRWYYDNKSTNKWIKQKNGTYIIDGEFLTPKSDATGFLYTYTPHIQGNKNFWVLWNRWFEIYYPNGSLLKADGSPDIYVIHDGKKRKIESMSALNTRFDPKTILTVPKTELSRYKSGSPISLPNFSIVFDGSTYYLLDGNDIRPFESKETVKKLGYHPDEIIKVKKSEIADYKIAKKIKTGDKNITGRLVESKSGSHHYIKGDEIFFVPQIEIAYSHDPNLAVEPISSSEMVKYNPKGNLLFADGTLMGDKNAKKIYIIENGKKRHIPDEKTFSTLGYKWENVVWVDSLVSTLHKKGESLKIPSTLLISKNETKEQEDSTPIALKEEIPEESNTNNISEPKVATHKRTFEETGKVYETPAGERSSYGKQFSNSNIESYIVAELSSGKILSSKNAYSPRPMASLTKVFTSKELFDQGLSLSKSTTYDAAKHKASYHRFPIADGEVIRNRDLLYSLLVSSLNTPAYMLVDQVDTKTNFLKTMNSEAQKLGVKNTYFTDPSGLDINTYTTAADYMKLFKHSLKNKEVSRILNMEDYLYYEIKDLDGNRIHRDNHSNNLKKDAKNYIVHESKTGYLYESGFNLAMIAERKSDGKKFLLISLGNKDYNNRFEIQDNFTNWALNNF